MPSKIIDMFTVTQVFVTDNTNTERVAITSTPTRVGSVARIRFWISAGTDALMAIRRGAGLSGDVIWTTTEPGPAMVEIIDTSPVSQYTLTNSDDIAYSMQVTMSVEQIS